MNESVVVEDLVLEVAEKPEDGAPKNPNGPEILPDGEVSLVGWED